MRKSIRPSQLRAPLLSSLVVGLFSSANIAYAQDATKSPPKSTESGVENGIDVIVVTAQRRAEPLQEVPLSVSALTGAQIKNANVTSADRLEQLVPGVRMGALRIGSASGHTRYVHRERLGQR